MDELRILIARLGWPSTSARWWTMQELAARLGKHSLLVETESELLQLLRSRRLEAEVVEVLCIFWMAAQAHNYSPTSKLTDSISRCSILADLLLQSMGLSLCPHDNGSDEVPEEFEIPQDFDGIQGSDLPRIFRTSMVELENETGLPFVEQMAFEWSANQAAYPDVPFQGGPWHFSRPLGNDLVTQISSRTALRGISAYLRTLDVAKKYWAMPTDRADKEALRAMPIHPTLAFLRPRRPAWFPGMTEYDGDHASIEASIQALVGRVQAARTGDELIAFSSPIVMSMERCVEVSFVKWSQTAGSSIADADLAEHLKDFWTDGRGLSGVAPGALSTTTLLHSPSIDQVIDDESKSWPLASLLGYDCWAYLQRDLYPGRLFLPTAPGSEQVELTPNEGQVAIRVDDHAFADLIYWNAGWGEALPKQSDGNCGTALVSRTAGFLKGVRSTDVETRSFYLWQVRTLQRSNSYDRSFSQALATGAMFV